jgi:hypothetical protein
MVRRREGMVEEAETNEGERQEMVKILSDQLQPETNEGERRETGNGKILSDQLQKHVLICTHSTRRSLRLSLRLSG